MTIKVTFFFLTLSVTGVCRIIRLEILVLRRCNLFFFCFFWLLFFVWACFVDFACGVLAIKLF